MDQIIDWLKTTIPGIILLAFVGSLACAAVIGTAGYLTRRFLPGGAVLPAWWFRRQKQLIQKILEKRQNALLLAYFSYHITHTLLSAVFGIGMIIISYLILNITGQYVFTYKGLIPLSGGFIFLFWGLYHVWHIDSAYKWAIRPLIGSPHASNPEGADG